MNKQDTQNSPKEVVLEAVGVSKTFFDGQNKLSVLDDIRFSMVSGERVAIIGASGTGKSTLLHILGGLDAPSSGHVLVHRENITQASARDQGRLRNRYLGFVYQFHHLLPEFNALENTSLPLLIRGENPKVAQEQAEVLLTAIGLGDRLTHLPTELSGGQKQRIAIARALMTQPACVLADEPTGNLDQKTATQVYEYLQKLQEVQSTAFLIVTHDRHLADKMDRVLVLENGGLHTL